MSIAEWVEAVAENLLSITGIQISVETLDVSIEVITLQKGSISFLIVPTAETPELVVPEFDSTEPILSLKMMTWQLDKLSSTNVFAVKNDPRQLICLGYNSNFVPVSFLF